MKRKMFFILLTVLVLSGEFLFYRNYKLSLSLHQKRIRKPVKEFVVSPFGKKLPKEPNAFPNEWMAYQRCYPFKEIKLKSYLNGMRQASEIHKRANGLRYEWQLAGPTNIGGRITDLAISPNSEETIYVGAASGGIFKTNNNGESWENIFTDVPVIAIGDIAVDPNNENILYAGTGEANASSYSFLGNGIYKTENGGESWEHIGLENSGYIGRIIVDYDNSQRIFVAACGNLFSANEERGIFRSDDGGLTWNRKLFVTDSTSAIDLVQDPNNPQILYAAMWERMRGLTYRRSFGASSGIWKTTDGGETWNRLTVGLPVDENVGRIGLSIAKSNPNVLYAFIDMPNYEVGIFKTDNGGESWVRTNDDYLNGMNSAFGWYFGQIRVDPNNENRIYVLGMELYRSDNGGNSWILLADYGNMDEIHVDHHAILISEINGRILEGNDGGLYYSDDLGNNWNKINNLPITQFYAIVIDENHPQRIYGGTQDNNTIRTLTGSENDWHAILGGDGFYCLVDYNDSNTIYAEYQWGNLFKSTDGGEYWYTINEAMSADRTNWSSPLAMDPLYSNVLYFGTYRIWKTTNGGQTWNAVSEDLTNGDYDDSGYHTITTIAVSSLNSNIVIAGTDDGRIHVSSNGGNEWNDVSAGIPNRWITRVAADPFSPNTIYATVSGFRWDEPLPHVFKSENLGENWIEISGNLPEIPINSITLDPNIPDRIFVGSDSGIFYSENGGETWSSISAGMPNVPVTDIKIHNETRMLVVGTYGCSVYKINLDSDFVQTSEETFPNPIVRLQQNYPNPFRISTTISFYLASDNAEKIELEIYNVKGQKIKKFRMKNFALGKNSVVWNGKDERNKTVAS
jgi:photosystem II stability/assembly factor-like uncharacterized protein